MNITFSTASIRLKTGPMLSSFRGPAAKLERVATQGDATVEGRERRDGPKAC